MDQLERKYDLKSTGEVGEFIDRLSLLPPSDWIAAVAAARDYGSASLNKLESLIAGTGRQIDAWCAVDGVETAGHIAFRFSPGDSRFLRNRASAIQTAKGAALGLLVRSELSPDEFERLYRPFRDLIPLGDLAEAGSTTPRSR